MQYNNNNNNPYNPYLCNSQHTPNVATAPPLDEVNYLDKLPRNHMYIQQPYPVYPYPYPDPYPDPYPNSPFMTPVEQHNREIQMQMRKKQQEDDCCCFGLITILCCCCIY